MSKLLLVATRVDHYWSRSSDFGDVGFFWIAGIGSKEKVVFRYMGAKKVRVIRIIFFFFSRSDVLT